MRVISGTYGGRPLKSLTGENTRPTTDKLKETLFNIIGPYFKGGNVLDLYAGSGALGIEAVSRGMDQATLVDSNYEAMQVILENIKMTKEEAKFNPIKSSARHALNTLANREEKFNLVFLDPPYAEQTIVSDIEKLVQKGLLTDIAVIVCEVAADVELPDAIKGIELRIQRKYGNKKIVIYQKLVKKEPN